MKENSSPAAHIVRVVPKAADIFTYKISDTYANKKGFVKLLTALVFFAVSFCYWGKVSFWLPLLLMAYSLLTLVVAPIAHRVSAGKVAAEMPVNIVGLCGTKFSVNDGENRLELDWSELDHVIVSKKLLLVFIAPRIAFVIPKDQMGKDREAIEALVKANSVLCRTVYRSIF